jgi:hypothetical protein
MFSLSARSFGRAVASTSSRAFATKSALPAKPKKPANGFFNYMAELRKVFFVFSSTPSLKLVILFALRPLDQARSTAFLLSKFQ